MTAPAPRIGPTELLFRLREIPSHGMPVRRVAPGVTLGGIADARETLEALYDDNARKLDFSPGASVQTKARVKEQAHLCAVISILNRRADAETFDADSDRGVATDGAHHAAARPRGPRS